ncbi:MAG TPA: AMP-dependent synthetase/ligase, partial [Stellaceae bacterium]
LIAEYRQRAARVTPDQVATIIYTSGTTGEPKGVMLTHNNLSSNEETSVEPYHMGPEDVAVSFLPLSLVYERVTAYAYLFHGVPISYVERMEDLPQALLEVRPTLAAAVPRVFEKLYANILQKGHEATGLKRKIFDWAMGVARESVRWKAYGEDASYLLNFRWGFADRIVFTKIRDGIGGRFRAFISGGGPLSREIAEFFWAVGIPVYQGYGLTETSPVVSANVPNKIKVATVGPPLDGVEVKIADDGEVLVRGALVMKGYWREPEATAKTLEGGWLHTGDVGEIDRDGYIRITDRKKDFIKNSGGDMIAPARIEGALTLEPQIAQAMVFGDRRPYLVAVIVPAQDALDRAKGDEAALQKTIGAVVARVNQGLANIERVRRFVLAKEAFTTANGQMTPTLKIRRHEIRAVYGAALDALYEKSN